jgi:dihydroorotase
MKQLIKSVTVIDAHSAHHFHVVDIYIVDGVIQEIGQHIQAEADEVKDGSHGYISNGWIDMRVNFCDPGYEYKEDIISGLNAAAAGGFAHVAVYPQTFPVIDHKSQINYILNLSASHTVTVHPVGCVSHQLEGKELAELYDMHTAGAIAFADGTKPLNKSGLLMRALQYTAPFGGVIISNPDDAGISSGGKMHEGEVSVSLGLKGIPAIAETIAIQRDLELLKYSGGHLHFSRVSTAGGVELIRNAKADGLHVTADTTIHHLCLADGLLTEFDSNYKMIPPLRSEDHIQALIEGINDGTIDAIVSDHTPENTENKAVEFDYASPGVLGVQIVYSLYNQFLADKIPLERFVACITTGPAHVLSISSTKIEEGAQGVYTFFKPSARWRFDEQTNQSKSMNSPFMGEEMMGEAMLVGI